MADGFALAEAFVEIGGVDNGFQKTLSGVKAAISGLVNDRSLRTFALGIGAALTAAFGMAVKSAIEAEDATESLRSALRAQMENADEVAKSFGEVGKSAKQIGKDADDATEDLSNFARSLSLITTNSKEAIQGAMGLAANLGVNSDQMKTLTEVGIGLAQRFFGGDLQAGMKAASEAVQGNYRELERLVPQLRNTSDAAQKLAIVQRLGMTGFGEAQEKTQTFSGQLKVFWNQLDLVSESFGEHLLPYLKQATEWLQGLTVRLQQLTPEQTLQITKWAGIALAIAGVIAFAPAIAAFGTMIVGTLGTIVSAIGIVGGALVALVTSPFGLVILGVGAIITAFEYLVGSGNTAVGRIIDGFMKTAEFLDHLFGSWQGFTAGVVALWHTIQYVWEEVWLDIKSLALSVWGELKSAFPNIVYGWGSALADFAVKAWNLMSKLFLSIKSLWQQTTNLLADAFEVTYEQNKNRSDLTDKYYGKTLSKKDAIEMSQYDADNYNRYYGNTGQKAADINKNFADQYVKLVAGKQLTQEQLENLIKAANRDTGGKIYIDNANQRDTDQANQNKADAAAADKAMNDRLSAIQNWAQHGLAESPTDHYLENKKQQDDVAKQRADLDASRRKQWADDLNKIMHAPSLTAQLKATAQALKDKLGLGGLGGLLGGVNKTADDLKKQAVKTASGVGNLYNQGMTPDQIKRTDISETFKQMAAFRLLGGTGKVVDSKTLLAQQALAEHRKQTAIQERTAKAAEITSQNIADAAFTGKFG